MKQIIVLIFTLLCASNAHSSLIYDFTGDCTVGCTGSVTGVLTLNDSYSPGDLLENVDFISWVFSSSSQNYTVNGTFGFSSVGRISLPSISGLAITTGSFGYIDYTGSGTVMRDFGDGTWASLAAGLSTPNIDGNNANWSVRETQIPEPTSLALLGLSLVGLGFSRKKKNA